MAFVGVKFDDSAGGGIAIVRNRWLTTKKEEMFWPPYKSQEAYRKAIRKGETPIEEEWYLNKILRCFFTCEKSQKKIKLAENFSDIQSERYLENSQEPIVKRPLYKPRKLYSDSESDDENCTGLNKLPRPPKINQQNLPYSRGHMGLLTTAIVGPSSSYVTPPGTPSTSAVNTPISVASSSTVTENVSLDKAAFQRKLVGLLAEIKQQNEQIISWLTKQGSKNSTPSQLLPDNIPVALPLTTIEDLKVLETYLSVTQNFTALSSYLATLGSREAV